MKSIKEHLDKKINWFILAVAILLVYKALDNFGIICEAIGNFISVISPFLIGSLLAYLLYIPTGRIEEKIKRSKKDFVSKKARQWSVLIVYILLIIFIVVIVNVIMPVLLKSITELFNNFQNYYDSAINRYNELPEDSILKSEQIKGVMSKIKDIDLGKIINLENITKYVKGAVNAVTGIIKVFLIFIFSIYILLEKDGIMKLVRKLEKALFEEKTCNKLERYIHSTNEIFFKFLSSQFIDAIIVAILMVIIMSILKVKYAALLGVMIGLFNMIPYFGAIIATVIAILITIVTGGLSQAIWMGISVIIVQQIDANIINPKILGNSLELSKIVIILAVTLGQAYFGIWGMFLAVPVVAVFKIFFMDYIDFKIVEREKNKKIS